MKKIELQRDLYAAYDYIEEHLGKDALNELLHHTKKQSKRVKNIEELQYKLQSAYMFIEMSMGKQTLNTLIKATDREYATMQTDKLLTIHDPKEFDDKRMEYADLCPDANYFEYATELFK